MDAPSLTRRTFLGMTLGAGSAALLACADSSEAIPEDDPVLAGTCEPAPSEVLCTETPEDIEGPFYLPEVPERSDLDTLGEEGVSLALTGLVTDTACTPLAEAVVEIWHADPAGAYDNSDTHNYRGWVRTDAAGRYAFTTLVPGRYLNGDTLRPAHIHIKVFRDGAERLTSQIYFQDDPYLDGDPWAEPARTVCLEPSSQGVAAVFDVALV